MSKLVWIDGSLFRAVVPPSQFFFLNNTCLNTFDCAVLTRSGGLSHSEITAIYKSSTVSLPQDELSTPPTCFCPMLVPVFPNRDSILTDDPAYFESIPDGEYVELGGALYGGHLLDWADVNIQDGFVSTAGPVFQKGKELSFCDTPTHRSGRLLFRKTQGGFLLAHTLFREITYRQVDELGFA